MPDRPMLKCPLCPQKEGPYYSHTSSLLRHVQTKHYTPTSYKCKSCGKFYHRRDNLLTHIHLHHGGIEADAPNLKERLDPPERCPICQIPLGSWGKFKKCIVMHAILDEEL
ncbi:hypothetical protein N7509_013405 [Penicillium cosmopolitanum]|uniref:C2H2-type domain-containing protein n=1 Tax=Penicillium cosmopolitanum TaxID=1131564 RepID=A0A9W9SFZ3_9EURO|nr:uncharacterized protein N7509_013405 [Penicillium cosmopolitanum]KAJ5376519.1 hypothetical protein N7509_013405 [Penicillium cosmopolitanum]